MASHSPPADCLDGAVVIADLGKGSSFYQVVPGSVEAETRTCNLYCDCDQFIHQAVPLELLHRVPWPYCLLQPEEDWVLLERDIARAFLAAHRAARRVYIDDKDAGAPQRVVYAKANEGKSPKWIPAIVGNPGLDSGRGLPVVRQDTDHRPIPASTLFLLLPGESRRSVPSRLDCSWERVVIRFNSLEPYREEQEQDINFEKAEAILRELLEGDSHMELNVDDGPHQSASKESNASNTTTDVPQPVCDVMGRETEITSSGRLLAVSCEPEYAPVLSIVAVTDPDVPVEPVAGPSMDSQTSSQTEEPPRRLKSKASAGHATAVVEDSKEPEGGPQEAMDLDEAVSNSSQKFTQADHGNDGMAERRISRSVCALAEAEDLLLEDRAAIQAESARLHRELQVLQVGVSEIKCRPPIFNSFRLF